jgi:hypothetical protein
VLSDTPKLLTTTLVNCTCFFFLRRSPTCFVNSTRPENPLLSRSAFRCSCARSCLPDAFSSLLLCFAQADHFDSCLMLLRTLVEACVVQIIVNMRERKRESADEKPLVVLLSSLATIAHLSHQTFSQQLPLITALLHVVKTQSNHEHAEEHKSNPPIFH